MDVKSSCNYRGDPLPFSPHRMLFYLHIDSQALSQWTWTFEHSLHQLLALNIFHTRTSSPAIYKFIHHELIWVFALQLYYHGKELQNLSGVLILVYFFVVIQTPSISHYLGVLHLHSLDQLFDEQKDQWITPLTPTSTIIVRVNQICIIIAVHSYILYSLWIPCALK